MTALAPDRPAVIAAPKRRRSLGRVMRSGVTRRWVQTTAILLATAAAVTAGVLGVGLLVASIAPFEHAFAQQNGPHLTVQLAPGAKAPASVAGVTASAGPYPTAAVTFKDPVNPRASMPPFNVVARSAPGGAVDKLTMTDGRWATGPGEIVLAGSGHFLAPPGTSFSTADGRSVKVVGVARSVSGTADAWMTPSGLAALHVPSTGSQMLYRFAHASTAADLAADRDAVGPVVGARSWLDTRLEANRRTAIYVPFLLAFGCLSLVLAVLMVGTVVAGAVGSSLRRIGVLKAIGFTPAQVVRGWLAQALIPASVGAVLGLVAGNLVALPVLSDTERIYGTASLTVTPWVDIAVFGGVLAVVAATAAAAAARAGRLRTVDALALGRTPAAGRGRAASRLLGRLPLPRSVSLGLARPFRAPAHAAVVLVAIAFGATAVTLSAGLAASLTRTQVAAEHTDFDVVVTAPHLTPPPAEQQRSAGKPPGGDPAAAQPSAAKPPGEGPSEERVSSADPAKVAAILVAQQGVTRQYGSVTSDATLAGLSGTVQLTQFSANPSWARYDLVSGRWFARPGEAVAASELLTASGKHVGDTITVNNTALRIVGEVFDPNDDGHNLLAQAPAGTHFTSWQVEATNPAATAGALDEKLKPLGLTATQADNGDTATLVLVIDSLAGLLTALMVAVAGLGVLNIVVLDVRDRVRDLGIQKALGMTPRQTLISVLASVVPAGLLGGVVGVPVGIAVHGFVLPAMFRAVGSHLPPALLAVYHPAELVAFALAGALLAVVGALLPAGWAARTRTSTALRAE